MKAKDFRDQSEVELIALEKDKRKELLELKNKSAREKKIEKPAHMRSLGKDIARILTVLREKELSKVEKV